MCKTLLASLCAVLGISGCALPGIRFEILQPPVLVNGGSSVVSSGGATIAVQPSGHFAGPIEAPAVASVQVSPQIALPAPSIRLGAPRAMMPAGPPDCTLEEACRRIEALEKRLKP